MPRKKSPFDQAFGKSIRLERETQALSRQDLADRVGLSMCSLRELENGNRIVTLDLIVKLAYALRLSSEEVGAAINQLVVAYHWEQKNKPR